MSNKVYDPKIHKIVTYLVTFIDQEYVKGMNYTDIVK